MTKHLLTIFSILLPLASLNANQHNSLRLPRIQVVPIQDSNADRQYELLIKLPEGYADRGTKRHPVIYFTDAIWTVEILSATAEFVIEEAILVGISWQKNLVVAKDEWSSRYRDFRPRLSEDGKGEAENFLKFFQEDIITYIESNYRANPNNRTYFGYSLGGLFGAYTLLNQPHTFENYIIGSPSIGPYANSQTQLDSFDRLKNLSKQTNVFITYGALEKKRGKEVDLFIAQLKSRKLANVSLTLEVIEVADHSTAFPKTAVRSIYWLADLLKP